LPPPLFFDTADAAITTIRHDAADALPPRQYRLATRLFFAPS